MGRSQEQISKGRVSSAVSKGEGPHGEAGMASELVRFILIRMGHH